MSSREPQDNIYQTIAITLGVIIIVLLVLLVSAADRNNSTIHRADTETTLPDIPNTTSPIDAQPNTVSTREVEATPKTTCIDVTSIDYNWDNDVLCTRPDGSKFYTDYAGGHANDPSFERN
jgi:hypothetical protein